MSSQIRNAVRTIREHANLGDLVSVTRTQWTGEWSVAGLLEYLRDDAQAATVEIRAGILHVSCSDEYGTTIAEVA